MRIVLLGPPGAGKGTQAGRLAAVTGASHIATGNLVRAEIAADTDLGKLVKRYNDRGELVPDETIVQLVSPSLTASTNWILDGFPRDEAQARILDEQLREMEVPLDRVILLEIADQDLTHRLLARRQSASSGKIYNLVLNPPPPDDPGPFIHRADDCPEEVERRLAIYHETTEPLKTYYAARNLLTPIDASQPPDAVTSSILHVLQG